MRKQTDNAGNPSGTVVTNAYCNDKTLSAGSVTHIPLHAICTISSGTTYWRVFSYDSGSGTFQGGTSGDANQCKYYVAATSTWTLSSNVENIYFKTYGQTNDVSGSNNNGQVIGTSSTSSGRFGRAGSFDGTNDYVNCGNFNTAGDSNKQTTIEFWFKGETGGAYLITRYDTEGTGRSFFYRCFPVWFHRYFIGEWVSKYWTL